MEPPTGDTIPEFNIDNANPELIPLLVNVLSSEKGAAFRQLILEAVCIFQSSIFFSGHYGLFKLLMSFLSGKNSVIPPSFA